MLDVEHSARPQAGGDGARNVAVEMKFWCSRDLGISTVYILAIITLIVT